MTLYLLFVAGADQATKTGLTYDAIVVYEGPVPAGATMVCARLNMQYRDDNNEIRYVEGCVPAEPGYQRLLIRVPMKGLVSVIGEFLEQTVEVYRWIPFIFLKTITDMLLFKPSFCNLGEFKTERQDYAGSFTRLLFSCGDTKCYWLLRSMRLIVDQIDDGAVVTARLVVTPPGWAPEEGLAVASVARGTLGESRFGPLKGTAILGFGSPGSSLYLDIRVEGGNATGNVEVELAGPYDQDYFIRWKDSNAKVEVYAVDESGNRIDLASEAVNWNVYSEYCISDLEPYGFDGWLVKPVQG